MPSASSVLYLKGQASGCWAAKDAQEKDFGRFCGFVERVIHKHNVGRVIWDGDHPDRGSFAEVLPVLFRRLRALRSTDDPSVPQVEIKAFRLKGTTQELQDAMVDAFSTRGLGLLTMTVLLLSGAQSEVATSGSGDPVAITIEESNVEAEGQNPYAALGWYSLTEGLPAHQATNSSVEQTAAGVDMQGLAQEAQEARKASDKVVVCLGGGVTCNLEFERACKERIDSTWYCLYVPPTDGGAVAMKSSINVAHSAEAKETLTEDEWPFGGLIYRPGS